MSVQKWKGANSRVTRREQQYECCSATVEHVCEMRQYCFQVNEECLAKVDVGCIKLKVGKAAV
jgi:hypothetical protein